MIQMCHNDSAAIYDDERGNWVIKSPWRADEIIPKSQHALLPFSTVVNGGMVTDNEVEMDKLRKQAQAEIDDMYKP